MAIVFPEMTGQQEAEALLDTENKAAAEPPVAGDALYIVSNKWFSEWCQYSGFTYDERRKKAKVEPQQAPGPRPGPIDNADLLGEPPAESDLTEEQLGAAGTLRLGLVEKRDFWLLHEPTWKLLKGWYGCPAAELRREYHRAGGRLEADAHQVLLRVVARPGDGGGEREALVGASSMCKLSEVKAMACLELGLDPQQYDVHDYRGLKQGPSLEPVSFKTLTGSRVHDQQALLLLPLAQAAAAAAEPAPSSPVLMLPSVGSPLQLSSPRGSGGFYGTSPMSPLSRSFDRAPSWADDVVFESPGRGPGLAGLGNLGNTCFMNSSLQCLAHSLPLMQTFLSGAYRRDLNKDNPLSLGGKLALAFGALMEKLWRGGVGHVSPKLFKWQLAKFAPQFSGYAQQDSQELLAFLLDGLHEDLNRITDKPYVEDKDSDGRPDEEVAAEAWANYRRRNDSVIVDAFQGLYRSVLTCPQCGNQSVKFDPLMYLTLPLPSSKMRSLVFTAIHVDGSAPPREYGVEVPKSATIGQLYTAVAGLLGLTSKAPQDLLLLAQANDTSLVTYTDLKARVSSIEDPRPRFSFQRASPCRYLACVYPSRELGPLGGGQPVHIYHKARGSSGYVIPTVPLFLPADQLAALSTQAEGTEVVVTPGPGTAAVDAALQQLLRPFSRQQDPQPALDGGDGGDQLAGGSAAAMDDAAAQQSGAEAASEETALEAMEVEEALPNGTAAAAPAGGLDGPAPAGDEAMASASAPVRGEDAFDMWAAQKEDAARAAAAAAAAAASSPPFVLKCAKRNSVGPVSTFGAQLAVPEEGEPLVFVAEWQEAAAQLYDASPLLNADKDASAVALAERQRDGGKRVTLADCLETFLQPEQLDAEDSWYCGRCKAHVQADKKLDLWSLPDTLVVHLKRFSYSRYSRDKLDTLVDFPLKGLDMAPYCLGSRTRAQGGAAPSTCYDLYAVSNHYGGMGGGHYTAYCRLPGGDGQWHTFDDSHVTPMEEGGVRTPAAYVLFYRRQGAAGEQGLAALLEEAEAQRQAALDVAPAGPQRTAPADVMLAAGAVPAPPPPAPMLSSGSSLGKRQPETIDEEDEAVDGAAGAIELD